MKRIVIVFLAVMFVCGVAFAQGGNEATPDFDKITQVTNIPVTMPSQWSIPMTETLPLDDASGNTAKVIIYSQVVDPVNLQNDINNTNSQITILQAQVVAKQAMLAAVKAAANKTGA